MPVYVDDFDGRRGLPQPIAANDAVVSSFFGKHCEGANQTMITVPVLGRIPFHRRVAPAVEAVFRDIEKAGRLHLIKKAEFGGVYCCRKVRGGNRWSPHAYAIALDLNINSLAYRDGREYTSKTRTNYLCAQWEIAPSLRALAPFFWRWGFSWGGNWKSFYDPMHMEATDLTCALLEGTRVANMAVWEKRMQEEGIGMGEQPGTKPVIVQMTTGAVLTRRGVLQGGEVMVPARDVLEALNLKVHAQHLDTQGKIYVEGKPQA